MDGMFYSLEETAEKLHKTEAEVNAIVKEGKLRVFFDGPNQLFKVDEVESLSAEASVPVSEPEVAEPTEAPSDEPLTIEEESLGLADDEGTMAFFEPSEDNKEVTDDIDDFIGLADDDATEITEVADAGDIADVSDESGSEDDFLMLSDDDEDQSLAEPAVEESVSDIGFEDETFADLSETLGLGDNSGETSALTSAEDTTLDGGGVNMLGESAGGYDLASDTMGDTKSASDFDEDSLENIEDDVNLDSFGSGSGLLDLSLQADDTSLGGILDEIYTSDDEGAEAAGETEGSAMAVTAAAEEMFSEGEMSLGEPGGNFAGAAMMSSFEPAPDTSSNMLGGILVLPFIAMIYTTVVVIAGGKGFKPSILGMVESYISYIFIGFIAVAIVVGLIACFAGGSGGAKKAKVKKEKKPKAKKEKKPKKKKEKKAKKKK